MNYKLYIINNYFNNVKNINVIETKELGTFTDKNLAEHHAKKYIEKKLNGINLEILHINKPLENDELSNGEIVVIETIL